MSECPDQNAHIVDRVIKHVAYTGTLIGIGYIPHNLQVGTDVHIAILVTVLTISAFLSTYMYEKYIKEYPDKISNYEVYLTKIMTAVSIAVSIYACSLAWSSQTGYIVLIATLSLIDTHVFITITEKVTQCRKKGNQ